MRTNRVKVRFWVVGPFLAYLLVFLLWYPLWQHSPHSVWAHALGIVFGAMTAVLAAAYVIGSFFSPWGFGPAVEIGIKAYETYFGRVGMPLFYTDSITLSYSDIQAAKRWWIDAFDCKVAKVPQDWDCQLPSDVALRLPCYDAPTILLKARSEVERAGTYRS